MKLIGLMMVRNEDWVLGLSARVALQWVDQLVLFDHASVDGTPACIKALAAEFPGRVHPIREDNPVWYEMAYRQRTLEAGRAAGGTHFAIIDADEILTGNLVSLIRGASQGLRPGDVLQTAMPCLWRSLDFYRSDSSVWSKVWLSLVFADAPGLCWQPRGDYDFHHRHPFGSHWGDARPFDRAQGGVMHLQWVNWRRLLAKQTLYKLTERVRWPERETVEQVDRKYHQACDESSLGLTRVPAEWWEPYADLMHHLNTSEEEPWQQRECKRLVAEHGSAKFAGLRTYGVC